MNIGCQVKTKKSGMFFLCSEPLPRAATGGILKPWKNSRPLILLVNMDNPESIRYYYQNQLPSKKGMSHE
jgi:hypothetical protein